MPYAPPYFAPAPPGPNAEPYCYSPYVATNTGFAPGVPIVYTGDPGVRNPFFNQGYVSSGMVLPGAATPVTAPYTTYLPTAPLALTPTGFNVLAGMPLPTNVAFPTGAKSIPTTDSVMMPPPIPPARLFQLPDAFGLGLLRSLRYMGLWESGAQAEGTIPPAISNASDSGDPYINNTIANQLLSPYVTNAGTYPPTFTPPSQAMYTLNRGFMSLPWSGGVFFNGNSTTAPYLTATGVLPPTTINAAPYTAPYLTLNPSGTPLNLSYANGNMQNTTVQPPNVGTPYLGGQTAGANTDDRQHPYWRTEMLQKAMNLTTVRTHQYAVWITVGMFEVRRQGDIAMLAQGQPQLAFDILGPEVGALNGEAVRYRAFFIVDRLQLHGFNGSDVGGFRNAVVYRRMIE